MPRTGANALQPGASEFCLLRLSSTCFQRHAILLATTFLGRVRLLGAEEVEGSFRCYRAVRRSRT